MTCEPVKVVPRMFNNIGMSVVEYTTVPSVVEYTTPAQSQYIAGPARPARGLGKSKPSTSC